MMVVKRGGSNSSPGAITGFGNSVDNGFKVPDLWETPTVQKLLEPDPLPTLPSWVPTTPIVPPLRRDPFGPTPSLLPVPESPSLPHDVDPPSRPPEWMFGPPYIARAPIPSA